MTTITQWPLVGRQLTDLDILFVLYWGNEISDPNKILLGEGNQYRYILVTDKNKFPGVYLKQLLQQAYHNSLLKVKDQKQIISGHTIVKSISERKRPDTRKIAPKRKT
jgi:hypothetical protein